MKKTLANLLSFKNLDVDEARVLIHDIAAGKFNDAQVASLLTIFLMRPLSLEELTGFKQAALELSVPLDFSSFATIDLCGTGGDGKDTFNISTLASFVVAGAGFKVVKHGNYGFSSVSGSSNVLEHLGYSFTNIKEELQDQLEKHNICFLHAPLFHPAWKTVGPIRKALGVRTFFNMLGPLINPAKTSHQLVGVANLEIFRLYAYLFQSENKPFTVVHSLDGYDEVSLTGTFKVATEKSEQVFSPSNLGLEKLREEEIYGGESIQEAATIFENVLKGKGTKAQNQVVLCNAALAIQCMDRSLTFKEAYAKAEESLMGTFAQKAFEGVTTTNKIFY
ncbi:anthranilate phosphoribosyltransferase [Xanthovirga aplysinae]|uniref:anthranilate phosphoribosyltransferase n=1 Tax=Xanthovirga aplysinae TaxID=2529853 RepID=UPI0012BB760C|nr:anthranilate phosphoribosyltransferase [Xanthovirga aplysinae]MTI31950.1 anthranilate phosphoribosyltransferase [Xanthovirga aplysinae]